MGISEPFSGMTPTGEKRIGKGTGYALTATHKAKADRARSRRALLRKIEKDLRAQAALRRRALAETRRERGNEA